MFVISSKALHSIESLYGFQQNSGKKLLNPNVLLLFCHEHVFSLRIFIQAPKIALGFSFFQVQSRVTKNLHYENLIEPRGFVSMCTVKYFASAGGKDIILS